jgi:hypothetical protein
MGLQQIFAEAAERGLVRNQLLRLIVDEQDVDLVGRIHRVCPLEHSARNGAQTAVADTSSNSGDALQ